MKSKLSADVVVEITQVVHLYGHILDGRLWDRLPDVFTDAGVFALSLETGTSMGGRRFNGIVEIRSMFKVVDHALAHHVSNVYVYETGGDVRALCKFFMPDTKGRLLPPVDPARSRLVRKCPWTQRFTESGLRR